MQKKSRIFLAKNLKLRAKTYEKVNDLVTTYGGMSQERVWGLSPGPHSRWDGASGYSGAIALGPMTDA